MSRPPDFPKNLKPFLFQGRCDAVIITAPSHLKPSNTVDMNMAGVEACPQSSTLTPQDLSASTAQSLRSPELSLGSWPTEILISQGSTPVFLFSHFTKPFMRTSVSGFPRLTCSFSIPSSAIPLMSEPF